MKRYTSEEIRQIGEEASASVEQLGLAFQKVQSRILIPNDGAEITVRQARLELLEKLDEGSVCPCCGQLARRYRRRLSSRMARLAIELYRKRGQLWSAWIHQRDLEANDGGGDLGKLELWSLVKRPDPKTFEGDARGLWRITRKGSRFALGVIRVPRHVFVYDGRREGFSDDSTDVREALGDGFDLQELLRGGPGPERTPKSIEAVSS